MSAQKGLAGEPDEGDAASLGVADLLAELRGAGRHLAGHPVGAQRGGAARGGARHTQRDRSLQRREKHAGPGRSLH